MTDSETLCDRLRGIYRQPVDPPLADGSTEFVRQFYDATRPAPLINEEAALRIEELEGEINCFIYAGEQKLAERCEWRVPQEREIDAWAPACSQVSSWPVGREEERFKFCPLCGKQIKRT